MTVNAIVSMAMLKVNADSVGMSVLENFQPFVLDRLYHSGTEAVSAPDLRSAISTEYGVDIPTAVIQTLTKRIARDGLLTRDYGILKFNREDFAKYDLATSRQAAQQNYEMLMRAGSRFAEAEFSISLAPEQFAAAFLEFLRDETVPLLKTVIEGRAIIAQPEVEVGSLRYVVASFILDAFSNDPALAAALSTVVKGGVIASALYFPDPSGMNRRLDYLRVFLDTTLLLRLAGACGPDFERAASDLATLAVSRGASLRCFDHTLKECLGVLDASATSVKRGGGRYFGEATEHMVSAGWSYSDVIEFRDNFEERLGALGVSIHEKPAHVARLTVDEERLDSILQKEVHYSSTEAKYKDIDSITAVYRLRGGRAAPSLSKARAVFVTTNTALVRGSRKFAKIEELERGLIPLCIPDFFLTTALWVSQELVAPNLPSRQLIADCVSAVRVSDHLWKLYVEKIDKLVVAGNVGPEDYVMLRQSLEVRALIMFDTSEEPENFTEATVDKVLERRRLNLAAEAEAEAQRTLEEGRQREERLREVAERDRSDRERATNALAIERQALLSRAAGAAKVLSLTVIGVLALLAVVGATFSFPSLLDQDREGVLAFIVSLAILAFLALSLYSVLTERGLPFVYRKLQGHIEAWVAERVFGANSWPAIETFSSAGAPSPIDRNSGAERDGEGRSQG